MIARQQMIRRQIRRRAAGVVAGTLRVAAEDLVPFGEQALGQMPAGKAGNAGNEETHRPLRCLRREEAPFSISRRTASRSGVDHHLDELLKADGGPPAELRRAPSRRRR